MRFLRLALGTFAVVWMLVVVALAPGSSTHETRSLRPQQFSGYLTIICRVTYIGGRTAPDICLIADPMTNDGTLKHDLDWDPDGTRVAFERGGAVYIRSYWLRPTVEEPPRGKDRRLLEGREPAWSPNGKQLAFVRGGTGSRDVYIVRDGGTNVRRLTHGSSDDYAPAWSPDGRTIAYTTAAAIRLVGVDGSRDRAFAAGQHPDWSVNGNRLAFEHAGDIWVQNIDGSGRTNVTKTPSLRETSPSWSPDGQARMAFVAQSSSGELGVYTLAIGRAAIRRYVEALEERPLVEPVVDWQPVRVLVPTVSTRKPILSLRDARGNVLRTLRPGCYSIGYVDQSPRHGIVVAGVGFSFIGLNPLDPAGRRTVRFVGRRWPSARHVSGCGWLIAGTYRYWDPAHPRLNGTFRVVDRP